MKSDPSGGVRTQPLRAGRDLRERCIKVTMISCAAVSISEVLSDDAMTAGAARFWAVKVIGAEVSANNPYAPVVTCGKGA